MNIALWIIQALLAIIFLLAGFMKLLQPKEKLAENMQWIEDFSANQIRLISILEILGALGLILPGLTGILPWLTPLAATGLALDMLGAAITHGRRKEFGMVFMNIILLLAALFVAYGRFFLLPL